MKKVIYILVVISLLSSTGAWAAERAPRITDREIVEKLTRLEEGQKTLAKRFDDLRAEMNGKFDTVNKRFDDLRAEMNSRFDTLQWMLGLFITISLVILGFVLRMQWQMNKRQTSLEATLQAHKEELGFLKSLIEKLLPPKGAL